MSNMAVNGADEAPTTALGWALAYNRRGFAPTPNTPGTKVAYLKGWQTERLSEFDIHKHFAPSAAGEKGIGLVLGAPSGGLVCADLDSVEAVRLGDLYLNDTGMEDGRPKKPRSHRFYLCPDRLPPHTTFTSPYLTRLAREEAKRGGEEGKAVAPVTVVELLSDRHQAMVPPTRTSDGEQREWSKFAEPTVIDPDKLLGQLTRLAVHAELSLVWPNRGQHHAAMALIGGLLRAGWDEGDVLALVEDLCPPGGDGDLRSVVGDGEMQRLVDDSVRRLAEDEHVQGWPTLTRLTAEPESVDAICGWLGVGGIDRDDRPRIFAGPGDLHGKTEKAWKALAESNHPPTLFSQGGIPTRIEFDWSSDGQILRPLTLDRTRYQLAKYIQWLAKRGKQGEEVVVPANPPPDLIKNVLAAPTLPLPVLNRVVSAPIFGPDGVIRTEAGYHESARVYIDLSQGLTIPPVPAAPTDDDIAAARTLILDELLGDFSFDGEASKANAVAMLLLPFGRELVNGRTPFHLIDAPTEGSGKGLLLQVLTIPTMGPAGAATTTEAENEADWKKLITSLLAEGRPYIVIDNIKGQLKSASLLSAITQPLWTDRVLGVTQTIAIEPRCVFGGTGNNVDLDREMARRISLIRLDTGLETPYLRDANVFRHEKLAIWAGENRGELVGAALTLWQAWLARGRPAGTVSLGGFESWAQTLGGVLAVAGVPGFLDNARPFIESTAGAESHWFVLVERWAAGYQGKSVTAGDLFTFTRGVEGFDFGKGEESSIMTRFGMALAKRLRRPHGNYRVEEGEKGKSKAKTYKLVRRDEGIDWPTPERPHVRMVEQEPTIGGGLTQTRKEGD